MDDPRVVWVHAQTGPFSISNIPNLLPEERKRFVATHIRPHCTPLGRGRWINVPRPELLAVPSPELTSTGRPRLEPGEIPLHVRLAARAKVEAMPLGTEFTSIDVLPEEWHRSAYQLSTNDLPFWLECWGPTLKRIRGRPSPAKVWTRGPAPMPDDPTAIMGAWRAANPSRKTFGLADLTSVIQPRYRCGMTRWLSSNYRTSGGTRGRCFAWDLDRVVR